MGAVQRNEDVGVVATQATQRQHLTAHRGVAINDSEVDALPQHRRTDFGAALRDHLQRVGFLERDDHRRTAVDDAGLFDGDLADRVTEQLHVIEPDRRDHTDAGVQDVGRIPRPAEADLDGRHIDRRVGKRGERECRRQLEVRDPVDVIVELRGGRALLIDEIGQRRDLVVDLDETFLADRLAVDADPFAHSFQMWARVSAAPQGMRPQ